MNGWGRYVLTGVLVVAAGLSLAAGGVYYEPQIRDIIRKDCARCHSGNLRNLTSWDSVKAYADNGMLEAMVRGPMRQFAGPTDASTILAWVEAGAPENPPRTGTKTAAATSPEAGGTFSNVVQPVLAERCLRCHQGPFRKLNTYDEVKAYVDSGRFQRMLSPEGPMNRFAGNDATTLLDWSRAGAPR